MKKSLRKAIQAHTEREVPCTENGLYHEVIHGKSHRVLRSLPDHCIDAYVTDPPAGIEFMQTSWDSFGGRNETASGQRDTAQWNVKGKDSKHANIPKMRLTTSQGSFHKGAREAFIKAMHKVFKEVLRVLKPGAYALVWAIPRTSHWTTTALEDAGFEIRDILTHVNVQGMPKGQDLGRMIDRKLGNERKVIGVKESHKALVTKEGKVHDIGKSRNQKAATKAWVTQPLKTAPASSLAAKWDGWSTTLKPCGEHWILARAPISEGTTVANVLAHGTGALNIDACRVRFQSAEDQKQASPRPSRLPKQGYNSEKYARWGHKSEEAREKYDERALEPSRGRWPPNFMLSHHPACKAAGTKKVKVGTAYEPKKGSDMPRAVYGKSKTMGRTVTHGDGSGTESVPAWKCHEDCPVRHLEAQGLGTSRSFPQFTFDPVYDVPFGFHSKPSRSEKNHQGQVENHHPTVKSLGLCCWLVSLLVRPGGTVLDTFCGSGTMGCSSLLKGVHFLGIEQDESFVKLSRRRLKLTAKELQGERTPLKMQALFKED